MFCKMLELFLLGILCMQPFANAVLRFQAVGDWGDDNILGKNRQARVAEIMEKHAAENGCDFIMSTGDNFYPDGAEASDDPRLDEQWRDLYVGEAIGDLNWLISLGNHDHNLNNEVHQLEFATTEPRFYLPWYWYNQTFESDDFSVLFVAVDSQAIRQNKYDPAKQLADLEQILSESLAQWKFVFNHHPPYSCARRWGDLAMHEQVVPIVERYNVDLFISGHEHCLQHMAPINATYPKTDYIISGGGGRSRYLYDRENCDIAAGYGYEPVFFDSTYGFTYFEVTHDSVRVEHFTYNNDQGEDVPESLYVFERPRNSLYV